MKKKVLLTLGVLSAALYLNFSQFPVYASQPPAEVGIDVPVQPCADIIEWRYKVENGLLYRRLYNYTRQIWIGEWELVS